MQMPNHMSVMPEVRAPLVESPVPQTKLWNLEDLCSLKLIRQHTKTDDIPHVTDPQLELYRRAAFEAAELYSGLVLMSQKRIEEIVKIPANYSHDLRRVIKHRLRYVTANETVYLYGPGMGHTMEVPIGTKTLRLPNLFQSNDWMSCCNPCNANGGSLFKVMYLAGYSCAADVPAGIVIGVLKWIAWIIENPGDTLVTVNDTARTGLSGMVGSNNIALGSGALEQWRMYNNEAY